MPIRLLTVLTSILGSLLLVSPAHGSTVVAWGDNTYRQCNVPVPNSGFIDVAGWYHTLGLKTDGSIQAWGRNIDGQCNVPVPNNGFIAVAAGEGHSLGLKNDGSIRAWGNNYWGQCNIPGNNSDIIAVGAGDIHSLGLKNDGSIVAWGDNSFSQLNIPAPNSSVIAIAAGRWHNLGLKNDGSIVAWGRNIEGQSNVPAPNGGFIAVAGGGYHSLGLKSNGSIVAWGWNEYGQCDVPAPNSGYVAIAAGWGHSLGLKNDGSIVAWGMNIDGQCNVPVPNSGFIAIAAGNDLSLGLKLGEPDAYVVPVEPPYVPPTPPAGPQDKLVYVVHGCCTSEAEFNDFWINFRNAIDNATGPDWKVEAYDWTQDSGAGPEWLDNAIEHGIQLGQQLANGGYQHIHFIGHSLGSAVIGAATWKIKQLAPNTVIHTTFLDSYHALMFGPWGQTQQLYGGFSNWSEQYYSQEPLLLCGGTGPFTQVQQHNSHNVDVSFLDPTYDILCLSSHAWPKCFYRYTVAPGYAGCDAPDETNYPPYGFGLSREVLGNAWASIVQKYPLDVNVILGDPGVASAPEDNSAFHIRQDAPLNIAGALFATSPNGTVGIAGSGFTAATVNSPPPGKAWITVQFTNGLPINFVDFDLQFTSALGAKGLLKGYVDDQEIGFIDEQHTITGVTKRNFNMIDVAPGIHTLAFRLDQFGPIPSSVTVGNVATGRATFVSPGDINVDDVVNVDDLLAVINAWGPCPVQGDCPADIAPSPDGDGTINVDDLLTVINNWG